MNAATLTHPAAIDLSLALICELGAPLLHEVDGDELSMDWDIAGGKAVISIHYFGATDNLSVLIAQDELRWSVRIRKGLSPAQIATECRKAVERWVHKYIPNK